MADQTSYEENKEKLGEKAFHEQKKAAVDAAFKAKYDTIIPVELEKEMKKSFIDYAMSVITDRALPDEIGRAHV